MIAAVSQYASKSAYTHQFSPPTEPPTLVIPGRQILT
nr:MAG TPA: hypothetical protein [Bacteriophage sp.]